MDLNNSLNFTIEADSLGHLHPCISGLKQTRFVDWSSILLLKVESVLESVLLKSWHDLQM